MCVFVDGLRLIFNKRKKNTRKPRENVTNVALFFPCSFLILVPNEAIIWETRHRAKEIANTNNRRQLSVKAHVDKGISQRNNNLYFID